LKYQYTKERIMSKDIEIYIPGTDEEIELPVRGGK